MSAIGLCETCKWWAEFVRAPYDGDGDDPDDWSYEAKSEAETWGADGYSLRKRLDARGGRMGRCILTVLGSKGKAAAVDGSDYFAVLETAPDFGCVQFEPKP